MPNVLLKAILPHNRDRTGTLFVYFDGKLVRTFEVLGRGSAGPGDTQFKDKGNTPTGTYRVTGWGSTAGQSQNSYGPYGKAILEPVGGNAKIAHDIFGRDLLRIHGGKRSNTGKLRPTYGCLRLRNDDVLTLHMLLVQATVNDQANRCDAIRVTLTVQEGESGGMCVNEQIPVWRVFDEWVSFTQEANALRAGSPPPPPHNRHRRPRPPLRPVVPPSTPVMVA